MIPSSAGQWSKAEDTVLYVSFSITPSQRALPKGIESVDRLIGLRDSSARMAMLKLRNAMLEIFEFASPAPKPGDPDRPVNDCGLTHICLHVSGIDDEYQRLRNAGMRFHSPPLDAGPTRCCYGRDPDGNVIELLEFTRPDDPLRL